MNHWLVAPLILPAITAAVVLIWFRYRLMAARLLSLCICAALVSIASVLLAQAASGRVQSYTVGDWPAPFGIVLVLDRLSAAMILLTAVLGFLVLAHAILADLDRRGWHFHSLFQFQLLGLNGAFLTGDLFNLFVFFEVLLIASYGLMLHGQGPARLKAGVQYVVVNLVGSTLFLIALGLLYGSLGTLNMADMARRAADVPQGNQGLVAAGAGLLIVVFALKAALLPLHLWLPHTYANTSAPVAALLAILTKVGVYSIVRTCTLIFSDDTGGVAWPTVPWMLPAALLTAAVGFIGMLAARGLRELCAYAVLGSTGTLLIAVATFGPGSLAAAIYYLPHSTLAGATLFLVADLVTRHRRSSGHGDTLTPGPRFAGTGALSLLFLASGVAMTGLPPLSGFVGKLLILDGARPHAAWPWIWAVVLLTTLLGVLALARAGSTLFWKHDDEHQTQPEPQPLSLATLPIMGLLMILVALTVLAGPATDFAAAAADQLFQPSGYIEAVLGSEAVSE